MRLCLPFGRKISSTVQERPSWKRFLPVLLMLLASQLIYAQGTVRGKVAMGDTALSNVTVQIKGTNIATQTDNNGNFEIAASPNATLVFSAVGYAPIEERV